MTYKNKLLPWCIVRSLPNRSEAFVLGRRDEVQYGERSESVAGRSPAATLSQKESHLIIRFRRRSDAEAHLQILRVNNPTASYEIIFDVTPEKADSTAQQETFSYNSYRE
ncbi:MAG TPA: hypothetical protein V6C90_24680 [Coleofasciculaceae cyanobacterium]|jgi:hypothetical protein